MTSTSTEVRAEATTVGLIFVEQPFMLSQLTGRLDDLTRAIRLLSSGYLRTVGGDAVLVQTRPAIQVQSVSMQSPLEIWISVTAGAGAGAVSGATILLAERLVSIYSKFSRARTEASADRLSRTLNDLAREYITEELNASTDPDDLAAAMRVVAATQQVTVVPPEGRGRQISAGSPPSPEEPKASEPLDEWERELLARDNDDSDT